MKMIRTFIAIELKDKETIENIISFTQRLKQNQPKIKLVEPVNLHMTVKFLGNIPETQAPKIYSILHAIVSTAQPSHSSFSRPAAPAPRASVRPARTRNPRRPGRIPSVGDSCGSACHGGRSVTSWESPERSPATTPSSAGSIPTPWAAA